MSAENGGETFSLIYLPIPIAKPYIIMYKAMANKVSRYNLIHHMHHTTIIRQCYLFQLTRPLSQLSTRPHLRLQYYLYLHLVLTWWYVAQLNSQLSLL